MGSGIFIVFEHICVDKTRFFKVLRVKLTQGKGERCVLEAQGSVLDFGIESALTRLVNVAPRGSSAEHEVLLAGFIEKRQGKDIGVFAKFVRVPFGTDENEADLLAPEDSESSPRHRHKIIAFIILHRAEQGERISHL